MARHVKFIQLHNKRLCLGAGTKCSNIIIIIIIMIVDFFFFSKPGNCTRTYAALIKSYTAVIMKISTTPFKTHHHGCINTIS